MIYAHKAVVVIIMESKYGPWLATYIANCTKKVANYAKN